MGTLQMNKSTTVVIAAGAVLAAVIVTRTPAQQEGGQDSPPFSSQVPPASMQESVRGPYETVVFVDPCPWDCGGDDNGDVGIVDFLALLATWGEVGVPCDFDGNGVGIIDFLKLLANWGPCP